MTGDNLAQYYSTQNDTSGGVSLWPSPANTMLWPTILMLAVAVVASCLAGGVLIAYFWGTAAAERWEGWRSTFGKISPFIKIGSCAAGVGGMVSTSNITTAPFSLWYLTCTLDQEETMLQNLFSHVIDFSRYCLMQVVSHFHFCVDFRIWEPIS
jgi:hypothetical protein